jgi:hypothetical protein
VMNDDCDECESECDDEDDADGILLIVRARRDDDVTTTKAADAPSTERIATMPPGDGARRSRTIDGRERTRDEDGRRVGAIPMVCVERGDRRAVTGVDRMEMGGENARNVGGGNARGGAGGGGGGAPAAGRGRDDDIIMRGLEGVFGLRKLLFAEKRKKRGEHLATDHDVEANAILRQIYLFIYYYWIMDEDPEDLAAAFFARQSEKERAKTILPIDDWKSVIVKVVDGRRMKAPSGARRYDDDDDDDHDDDADNDDDHDGDEDDVNDDDGVSIYHTSPLTGIYLAKWRRSIQTM